MSGQRLLLPIGLCTLIVAANGIAPESARADSRGHNAALINRPPGVTFEPPTDDRLDDSAGGATRPASVRCRNDAESALPLSALLPERQVGLTAAARPSFFVYLPPTSAREAYFSLKTQDGDAEVEVYGTLVSLAGREGVLQIELPETAPELERDRTYSWQFGVLCNPAQTDMPWIEGQVRRVAPAARPANFDALSPLERAAWAGQVGLWYDTLALVAQEYSTRPEDAILSDTWTNLLSAAGLNETLAQQPLLDF